MMYWQRWGTLTCLLLQGRKSLGVLVTFVENVEVSSVGLAGATQNMIYEGAFQVEFLP